MDSLLRKIGVPPYRLDQIIPILDEAFSWISNPEKPSDQFFDAAVETIESLEVLAWLVEYHADTLFPEVLSAAGPSADQLAVLGLIEPNITYLKDWLFDVFQPSQISQPALSTATLCQHCNWSFRRITRGRDGHHPDLPEPMFLACSLPRYLLANDNWPQFPVLEERSLQGCEFCLFLREHLLQLGVPEPGEFDEEPVSVWIGVSWFQGTRSLKYVVVQLCGDLPYSGKSLHFSVDTTNGGCLVVMAGR